MKVGVVGGTGNISAAYVPSLLELGHEVVCLNRGRSGAPHPGARWIEADRSRREEFIQTVRRERFDAAIDMVCFTREEAETGFEAFREVGCFVHCSTVCTYGVGFEDFPVGEDRACAPITDYGRGKAAADDFYLSVHREMGFPVTILKPSTTFGPVMGLPRQIALELSFIDRIRKGKPILVCGEANQRHQFLHVEDAAPAFVHVLGRERCIGEVYNLVGPEVVRWRDYHRAVMSVLGREVPQVGVPLERLEAWGVPGIGICSEIFSHESHYSGSKIMRDVPEFQPRLSLEAGIARTIEALDREGRIPDSDALVWEDEILAALAKNPL